MTQMEPDDDDDSGGERPLYIKEEDDDEPIKEEDASNDSMNDTRLSELHNTTIKTENDSEEDKPLVNFALIILKIKISKIKRLSLNFFTLESIVCHILFYLIFLFNFI